MSENDPGKKMNRIINSPQKELDSAPQKKQQNDVFAGIPRAATPPKTERKAAAPALPKAEKREEKNAQPERPWQERSLRALWTTASVISMLVNIVVIAVLLALYQNYKIVQIPNGIGINTPKDLLKGLYDNFELMDQAHIQQTINVNGEIPVQFPLRINQPTTVTLSEAVTIEGARVALTTGGLNIINAPATVTLPAGTNLPIILDMEVQVDQQVAIENLPVPVDIPLAETELHQPFTGLQDVVRPLYCLIDSNALSIIDGSKVCP